MLFIIDILTYCVGLPSISITVISGEKKKKFNHLGPIKIDWVGLCFANCHSIFQYNPRLSSNFQVIPEWPSLAYEFTYRMGA